MIRQEVRSMAMCALVLCCSTLAARSAIDTNAPLPSASEVVRRILERVQAVAETGPKPLYTFKSQSVLKTLDASGKEVSSEEKLYQVDWIGGLPIKKLLAVKGRDLDPEDLARIQRQEEAFRERLTALKPREMAARGEGVVTAQLLERYRFEVQERVWLDDRPTLIVHFRPKESPDAGKTIQEKILNRLHGTLWIDEADADPARIFISLSEPLWIGWLAILGSVSQCDFHLERQRMPEGLWINRHQRWEVQCRKLATPIRFRKVESSSDFQKASPDLTVLAP